MCIYHLLYRRFMGSIKKKKSTILSYVFFFTLRVTDRKLADCFLWSYKMHAQLIYDSGKKIHLSAVAGPCMMHANVYLISSHS